MGFQPMLATFKVKESFQLGIRASAARGVRALCEFEGESNARRGFERGI